MADLFTEIQIGDQTLKNRIVMAPLTRCRAVENNKPNDLMALYYEQRASAGLIISEATQISPMGIGYPCTPGIHTREQIAAWQKVTDAVHEKGGKIFLQLWHVGRVSHSSFLGGELPVSASAVAPRGEHFTFEGMKEFETPRALKIDEIKEIVNQYAQGAKNAIAAGFDGVEIHGANGYLIDQFIKDGTNKRDDIYGGSIENRARFLFEVVDAVTTSIGAERTGLRLSPSGAFNDMYDENPEADYKYICKKLNNYDLAYLHIINSQEDDRKYGAIPVELEVIRNAYHGTLMANGGFSKESATEAIEEGLADLIAFGAIYISNPDLVERFEVNAELTPPNPDTFYTQDEKGYTDYTSMHS